MNWKRLKQKKRNAIKSNRAELGIVYGRRRVGKSTLLENAANVKNKLFFEGIKSASLKQQIDHFTYQLAKNTNTSQIIAHNWHNAFDELTRHIGKKRCYIIFDEFPWMASGKTELVSLLKYYWDNHWKKNQSLTLVLCGSIAGFMVNHIVHSEALHNRKTFEIKLQPLPASETKLFFKDLRSEYEISKFLIVFGGIPKYLEQIDPHIPFENNVDKLCFQKSGFFKNEFETIFKEQFKVTKNYEKIVSNLALKSLSKQELGKKIKIRSGGGLSSYIDNLERADFIKVFNPTTLSGKRKSKTQRVVLWDEWLRFYFTYVEPNRKIIEINTKPGLFEKVAGHSLFNYLGLSFEQFCMKNLPSIFQRIGYDIHTIKDFGPFFRQRKRNGGKDEGLQIDILVHRRAKALTLIECKFSSRPIGSSIVKDIERKIKFLKVLKNYTIEKVLISCSGITNSLEKKDYFHHVLGVEDLF